MEVAAPRDGERAWASIACVGAGEAGPSAEIVAGLRIREVVRPRLAPWYPNARADVEATARCEHGDATATAASGGGGGAPSTCTTCAPPADERVLGGRARRVRARQLRGRPAPAARRPDRRAERRADEALASTSTRRRARAGARALPPRRVRRARAHARLPARLCDGKDGREPCPTRRFTLDDMIVRAPRPHARSVPHAATCGRRRARGARRPRAGPRAC